MATWKLSHYCIDHQSAITSNDLDVIRAQAVRAWDAGCNVEFEVWCGDRWEGCKIFPLTEKVTRITDHPQWDFHVEVRHPRVRSVFGVFISGGSPIVDATLNRLRREARELAESLCVNV